MQQGNKRIYTVSQLTAAIKFILEEHLPSRLTVRGEITDFKRHGSGHRYFSLKDEQGLLPAVMWKSSAVKLKFEPENGTEVLATGFIDVYMPQGKYQFYVEKMEPAGLGALQLAFEQMKEKLRAEGLFDDEHKKPLPAYPMRIGILTSSTGAAVEDIKDSIWHRWPCAKLFLYPVPVQGEGAAERIATAITDVNRRNRDLKLDVLIVGRGGGSLEDLWQFNEEILARAIFASEIPVISAVGHEVDFTIADFVADVRASTPTKAGVAAVPDIREVSGQLGHFESIFRKSLFEKLSLGRAELKAVLASMVFRNPRLPVENGRQRVDELENSLTSGVKDRLAGAHRAVQQSYGRLIKVEPHRLIGRKLLELSQIESRVQKVMTKMLAETERELSVFENRSAAAVSRRLNLAQVKLAGIENRLGALDPRSVLNRGYSITINKESGAVVRGPEDIVVGSEILTEFAGQKRIESRVTKK